MSWSAIVSNFIEQPTPAVIMKKSTTHKRCFNCQKLLPLKAFYAIKKTQHSSRCKPCYIDQQMKRAKK